MKAHFIRLLGLALILTASLSLRASHIAGAEITYTCVNPCTTRVFLSVLRYCPGSQVWGMGNIIWSGAPGCIPPPPIGAPFGPITNEVTPVCPSFPTGCTQPGSAISGVEQVTYFRDYDICAGSPCIFGLSWMDCCRSPTITGLAVPGQEGICIDNTIINTALPSCNNSPEFLNPPRAYVYMGQDVDISMGAWDRDGDSLTFELGPCFSAPGQPVVYSNTYSGTQPFGPTWNLSIESGTGLLHVDADPGIMIVGVVCVYVTEYRNGAVIGRVMRDMQITVLANPQVNTPPIVNPITNLSPGATLVGDHIYTCGVGPICFDVTSSDNGIPGQYNTLSWSRNLTGATFTQVGNPLVQDTIVGSTNSAPIGRFCWTPPSNGHYYVRFRADDNICPMPGIGERDIAIHVGQGPGMASATLGTCPQAQFSASGCGTGVFSYQWSGDGGFSSTLQNPTHSFPGPGTYHWSVTITNGWNTSVVQDSIEIPDSPQPLSLFNGVYYVSPCTGLLYDTITVNGNYPSYQWSNGQTTPSIQVYNGGNYTVTVTDTTGCRYTDNASLLWSPPNIYGLVATSNYVMLQNQKILLIDYDSLANAYNVLDSTWTDSLGYYYFCNVPSSSTRIKAEPDPFFHPTELPTYADLSLTWNGGIDFHPTPQTSILHNFITLGSYNPGGSGYIGGFVTEYVGNGSTIGPPVPGLTVFLLDMNVNTVVGIRHTNAFGYFSFANIPLHNYKVVVDYAYVVSNNSPIVSLTAIDPIQDSLDFRLHRTWLELVPPPPLAVDPARSAFTANILPNPFGGTARLLLALEEAAECEATVYDAAGRAVAQMAIGQLNAGTHAVEWGEALVPGMYLVRVKSGDHAQVLRAVKQ